MRLHVLMFSFLATAGVAAAQTPTIILSPATAALSAPVGSGLSVPQGVYITSGGGAITGLQRTVSYAAGEPTGWLKATLFGSDTPAWLLLQGDAAPTLSPGTYHATVTVRSKVATISPQTFAVTFRVDNLLPAIGVAATATLTAPAGSLTPVSMKLDVTNNGGGKLGGLQSSITYPPGETPGWLTAALGGSDAPTKLTLHATPSQYLPAGTHRATVHIRSNTSDSAQVAVTFTLTGINPGIALSPASVTFIAIIGTGDPAPQSVGVTNIGGGTVDGLTRNITYAAGQPTGWLTTALSARTAPTTLTLSAVNTGKLAPGVYTAAVQLNSTNAYNSPQTVAVTLAVGNSPAHLTITPTVHDFGSVGIGGASAAQAFTITNDGGLPSGPLTGHQGGGLAPPAAGLSGINPGDFRADPTSSCATASGGLAPRASCDIVLWFSPTAVGSRSAVLAVGASPGGNVTAALSGTGTNAQVIIVTPPSVDFGDVGLGLSSSAQRIVLTNPLPWPTGPLQPISGLGGVGVFAGPNPGDFSFDPNSTCAQVLSTGLPVGGSCYFDVSFIPLGLGPRSATLVFQMTPGGVVQIPFTGNGIVAQFITITPASHDFGVVDVGRTTAPQRFTLTNSGPVATGPFVTAGLQGANPGDFAGGSNGSCLQVFATGLAAGASCDFEITFTPQVDGPRTASLTLSTTPGGIATLQLSGTGVFRIGAFTISPTTHDFGDVVVGQRSAVEWFTVSNQSSAPLNLSSMRLVQTGYGLDVNSTCVTVIHLLASGESCAVGVFFAPQATGAIPGTILVTTFENDTATATLTGTGTLLPLSITPTALDFGTVGLGMTSNPATFLVSNFSNGITVYSEAVLSGPGAADYVLDPGTCLDDLLGFVSGCAIFVNFAPQVAGPRPATLTVTIRQLDGTQYSATATLTGTGVSVLSLTPPSHDFGSVVVGLAGGATFTVTNTGTTKVFPSITLTGPDAADFVVDHRDASCATHVDPGGTCTFIVFFMPQAAGPRTATASVSLGSGAPSASATLTGTGIANTIILTIAPASHDFGTVFVGQPTPATFTVTNNGNTPSFWNQIDVTGPNAADFAVDPNDLTCLVTLSPTQSCPVHVSFTPSAAGTRTATLTLYNNGPVTASTTAQVTGIGVEPVPLVITPTSHDFGALVVGIPGQPRTFTVTNNSGTKLFVNQIDLTGPNAADFAVDPGTLTCATYISPSESCTFTMGFSPQAAGARSATVTVSGGPGTPSVAATLTGTGVPAAAIAVTPSPYDFGSVIVGQASAPVDFTITNTGIVPTGALLSTLFTGPGAADYATSLGTCAPAVDIAPGASCTIRVTFTPQATGPRPATLTVTANNLSLHLASATVNLTGTGTPAAAIAVTPSPYDFGSVIVGQASAPVDFTITNTGIVPTGALLSTLFTGPGAADYATSLGTCAPAVDIAPGASCTVRLTFTPQAAGPRPATLTLTANNLSLHLATATVNLTGTGVDAASILVLTIAPDTFRFGSVLVGQTSPPATFTITNPTAVRTGTISSFALTGTGTADYTVSQGSCAGAVLDPGGTCDFSVTFTPQVAGGHPVTLTVMTANGEAGATELRGFGFAPAVLTVTPASQDFGFVFPGQLSAPVTFTVTNTGSGISGNINFLGISFSGPNAAEFAFFGDTWTCFASIQLAPGASCTIDVIFFPSTVGPRSATLTIAANGAGGGTGTASLTGGRTPAGVLTMTPAAQDFGSMPIGFWTLPTTFTVTNVGTTPAWLFGVEIQDPAGTNYVVEPGSLCVGTPFLDPGASCVLLVHFEPQSTGVLPATVVVHYDAGSVSASLTGTGTVAVSATAAARDLLGVPALTDVERTFLDRLGNHDGAYDLGDLLAYLKRHHLKVSPALVGTARRTETIP